ncbi:piezo-type mechanosensitive ion channel component 1-like isoform X2 [Oscarella lobularis]|uniref:piezo-type mechanosensitive ion channel component 1-like isoform X2 n=1 Tax=Oscarella lobularis TaxID=121494 RepID=UPI003313F2B2
METTGLEFSFWILYRLLFGSCLLASAIVRINAISAVYLFLLLIGATLPVHGGRRSSSLIVAATAFVVSICGLVGQAFFQLARATGYENDLRDCSNTQRTWQQIGLVVMTDFRVEDYLRYLLPDFLVFVTALVCLVLALKLKRHWNGGDNDNETDSSRLRRRRRHHSDKLSPRWIRNHFFTFGLFLALIFLPSIITGIYFVLLMSIGIVWAIRMTFPSALRVVKLFVVFYSALHLLSIYLYQFYSLQLTFDPDDKWTKFLGYSAISNATTCNANRPWEFTFGSDLSWRDFVNPAGVLFLYFVSAYEIHFLGEHTFTPTNDTETDFSWWTSPRSRRKGWRRFFQSLLGASSSGEDERSGTYRSLQSPATSVETPPINDDTLDGTKQQSADSSKDDVIVAAAAAAAKTPTTGWKDQLLLWCKDLMGVIRWNSWHLTVLAALIWSIVFLSWTTLVLLVWACIVWMVKQSRTVCVYSMPVLIIYTMSLTVGQYVYSLRGIEDVLDNHPWEGFTSELAYLFPVQILFEWIFFLTVREFVKVEQVKKDGGVPVKMKFETLTRHIQPTSPSPARDALARALDLVYEFVNDYWVLLCYGAFLLVSLSFHVSAMRIIYMIFFLLLLALYQASEKMYNGVITIVWWIVAIYSILFVLMLYLFQIPVVYDSLSNATSSETLKDIGLEKYETAELFVSMWTPVVALIVIALQLKYFHRPAKEKRAEKIEEGRQKRLEAYKLTKSQSFADVTDSEERSPGVNVKDDDSIKKTCSDYWWLFWKTIRRTFTWLANLVFRLLELHLPKGLLISILAVALSEVSAIELFPVFLLCLFVPWLGLPRLFYFVIMVWTSLTILLKMFFQLHVVHTVDFGFTFNCSGENINHANMSTAVAKWIGLEKLGVHRIGNYIGGYIVIVVLIALSVTISRRQVHVKEIQKEKGEEVLKDGCLFLDVPRCEVDQNVVAALKYVDINHFFELTGISICFLATAIVIACRSDAYALLYAVFLGIMLLLEALSPRDGRSSILRCFWPIFVVTLAVAVFVQYSLLVGLPSSLCFLVSNNYPWYSDERTRQRLLVWLFLPIDSQPETSQNKWFIMGDFVLLLLYSWQWDIFRRRRRKNEKLRSGTSESTYDIPDFTLGKPEDKKRKSILDGTKLLLFKYWIWVTMLVVFLAGVSRITIFCLGYIVGCFYFLWHGQEQLRLPRDRLLRRWRGLLLYNYIVTLIQAGFQLWACVYGDTVPRPFSLLFEAVCFRSHFYEKFGLESKQCPEDVLNDGTENCFHFINVGFVYDVLVFGFLLFQLQLFASPYFERVRDEMDWYAKKTTRQRAAILVDRTTREIRRDQEGKDKTEKEKLMESAEKLQKKLFRSAHKPMKDRLIEFHENSQFLYGGTSLPVITSQSGDGDDEDKDKDGVENSDGKSDEIEIEIDDDDEDEDEEKQVMEKSKMSASSELSSIESIWLALMESVNSLTLWLNRASASYVYVYDELRKARREEIQCPLRRQSSLQRIEPFTDDAIEECVARPPPPLSPSSSSSSPPRRRRIDSSNSSGFLDKLLRRGDDDDDDDEVRREVMLRKRLGKSVFSWTKRIVRLVRAVYWAFVARTDLVCYLAMVVNFIVTGSALSLILPLLVFLSGLLSNPRPSKTFWIVVIVYTEIVVVVRYVFQSKLIPLVDSTLDMPYRWTELVGVQRVKDFTTKAMADFVVLWIVSFHVAKLQLHGLWLGRGDREDAVETDETLPSTRNGRADGGKTRCERMLRSLVMFFKVNHRAGTGSRDYYTVMVFFDIISYVILVFGWSSFGQASSDNVASYFQQNYIPGPFLAMLLTQFISLLIDRALYVRGWNRGKCIYNILIVILIHAWVFLILPLVTDRSFTNNPVVQVWYFFKCLYMALSAAQVAAGYPWQRSDHWLMNVRTYPTLNGWLLQGVLLIPFLTELRELMDWCFTKTTLDMTIWFKVQDIWHEAFITKSRRKRESRSPRIIGQKKPNLTKFCLGGIFILFIVVIIWFPLLFISLINSSSVPNRPREVSVGLSLAGYQPLFSFTAQQNNLRTVTQDEYRYFDVNLTSNANQRAFLDRYSSSDVTRVYIPGSSSTLWSITPPARLRLQDTLYSNDSLNLEFSWSITRSPPTGLTSRTVAGTTSLVLNRSVGQQEIRDGIAGVLSGTESSVVIPKLFPSLVSGPANSRSEEIAVFRNTEGFLVNVTLSRNEDLFFNGSFLKEWWNVKQNSSYFFRNSTALDGLEIIIFSEPIAPPEFSFLGGVTVLGLYISIVLVIGQFLKGYYRGISRRIMYEDMEDPQSVMTLCRHIFLVRALAADPSNDDATSRRYLQLEEILVGELFVLYRLPEKLLQTTRMKEKSD